MSAERRRGIGATDGTDSEWRWPEVRKLDADERKAIPPARNTQNR